MSSLALEDPKKMTDCHSALGYLPICRVSPGMGRAFGGLEDIEEMDRSKIESKASPSNRRRNPRVAANARITIYLEDGRGRPAKYRSARDRHLENRYSGPIRSPHPDWSCRFSSDRNVEAHRKGNGSLLPAARSGIPDRNVPSRRTDFALASARNR